MTATRLTQLLSESSGWKRLLGFLMEENTHCKNRLAEILNNDFQTRLLPDMENFQTGFIQTDSMIALLRSEVAEFDKLMLGHQCDQSVFHTTGLRLQRIRHGISAAERIFSKQQTAFNGFLADNI